MNFSDRGSGRFFLDVFSACTAATFVSVFKGIRLVRRKHNSNETICYAFCERTQNHRQSRRALWRHSLFDCSCLFFDWNRHRCRLFFGITILPMKTVFLLVRHGEAAHNVDRVVSSLPETNERHLTAFGREQIMLLANTVQQAPEKVARIFHSPLARTRETAEILGKTLEAPLTEDVRLRETDFGRFNNASIASFHAAYPQKTTRFWTSGNDGVESFATERERVSSFCDDVCREFSGRCVLVVSHADTLQILYGILTHLSLEETFSFDRGICPKTGEMVRVERG